MCIRYDAETGEALKWSRDIKAMVPEIDWRQGKDTFPGYVKPIVKPYWGPDKPRDFAAEVVAMRWGLQPWWVATSKKLTERQKANWGKTNAYNSRMESVFEKPTWREPVRKRRCVVPINAFYEQADGRWWRFARPDGGILPVAGLYEEPNDYADLPTYTLVTTTPTDLALSVGHDRHPVILYRDEDLRAWMDEETTVDHLKALMLPPPEDLLVVEDAGSNKRKKREDDEPPPLL